MKNPCLGIWIDHNLAKIFHFRDRREAYWTTVLSFVEPRHRTTGQTGVPLPGHLGCNTESHDRNRREQELHRFYDRVIAEVPDDARLIVLGPGEAKRELISRMEQTRGNHLGVIHTETTPSKLTESQIMERVQRIADPGAHDQAEQHATKFQPEPKPVLRSARRFSR